MKGNKSLKWLAAIPVILVLAVLVGTVAVIRYALPPLAAKMLGPAEIRYDSDAKDKLRECFHFSPPAKESFVKGYRQSMHESSYLFLFEFSLEGAVKNQQEYVVDILNAGGNWSWIGVSPLDGYLDDMDKIAKEFGLTHKIEGNESTARYCGSTIYYGFTDGVLRIGLRCNYW